MAIRLSICDKLRQKALADLVGRAALMGLRLRLCMINVCDCSKAIALHRRV